MNDKEFEREIHRRQRAAQLRSLEADRNRAQTVGVGTAGAGETEIYMRGIDGTYLWNILHPAEVIELIHQLSASIGCHIMIKPRDDFASWRQWRQPTDQELAHLNGFAPFPELAADGHNIGTNRLTQQGVPDGVAADRQED